MKIHTTHGSIHFLLLMLFSMLPCTSAIAQLPVAQLRSVFPAGGQAGQTITLSIVESTDLDEISNLVFNHPGIQLTQRPSPLANLKTFQVKIAANVPPGYYSVRAQSRFGVSNARMFRVDALPVKIVPEADFSKQSPLVCELNSVVYSRCETRNDLDHYGYNLPQGKKVEVRLDSLALDSLMIPVLEIYQPDGRRIAFRRQTEREDPHVVFTTTQAGIYQVKVYDFLFRGSASYAYRLAVTDRLVPESLDPPVIHQIQQQAVKGLFQSPTNPNQTGIGKILVEDSKITPLTLSDSAAISGFVSPRQALQPLLQARVSSKNQATYLQTVPHLKQPVGFEQEPNDTAEQAQKLALPGEVYGRFLQAGDKDIYAFDAKKGDAIWLQIFAERDGQSLDPYMKLEQVVVDANAKQSIKTITGIAEDTKTNLYPNVFDTLTDDIDYLLKVPVDATYRLTVTHRYHFNSQNRLDYYRLKISKAAPAFHAVAMVLPNVTGTLTADTPSGCVVRKAGTATFKVLLNRTQGFAESVLITAAHTPPGVSIEPIVIPANSSAGILILRATPKAPVGFAKIKLVAQAVNTESATPQVLKQYAAVNVAPATVTWKAQATSPAVSRLGHSLVVSVVDELLSAQSQPANHAAVQHVTQSQQIWQSLHITRSNGFADAVTIKAQGIDKKSKIDVVAEAVAKAKQVSRVRFSFKPDAKTGWHVCLLKSSSQFNYSRNPQLLARTEQEFKSQGGTLKTKTTTLAGAKKTEADKTSQLAEINKQATAQKAKQKQLMQQVNAKMQMLAKLNTDLQNSKAEQQKAALQKQIDAKQAELMPLAMQLTNLQTAIKQTAQKVSAITTELKTTQVAVKKQNTEIEAFNKTLANSKKKLDKVRKDQKAKKVKYEAIEDRLVFYVHASPMTLKLKSPAKITLKKGATQEVKFELARKEKVTGSVVVALTVPPGISGLKAEQLILKPDQKTASIKITADANATPGTHTFCTIRGTIQHNSQQLSVDIPLTIVVP